MAFCLVDVARMGDAIDQVKEMTSARNLCLYKGSAEEKFSNVAPHLFTSPSPTSPTGFRFNPQ